MGTITMERNKKDVVIRQTTSEDFQGILVLWHELMKYHINLTKYFELRENAEKNFEELLRHNIEKDEDACVFVADSQDLEKNEIIDMCVNVKYRKMEIGRKLLEAINKWFQERGITRIELQAASKNPVFVPFWKIMGFNTVLFRMFKDMH